MEFKKVFRWTNPVTGIGANYTATITTDNSGKALDLSLVTDEAGDYLLIDITTGKLSPFKFYAGWNTYSTSFEGTLSRPTLYNGHLWSARGWPNETYPYYMSVERAAVANRAALPPFQPEFYEIQFYVNVQEFPGGQVTGKNYSFQKTDLTTGYLGDYNLQKVAGWTEDVEMFLGETVTVTSSTKELYEEFRDFKYYDGNPFIPPYAPTIVGPGWWWS